MKLNKKIVVAALVLGLSSPLLAYCFCFWSSTSLSGIHPAYSMLDNIIKSRNKEVENKYAKEIQPIIDEIKEQTKKKNELLAQIRELEKERLKDSYYQQFLLEQEKQLLGKEIDLGGIVK